MIYCEDCAHKNEWPINLHRQRNSCEICKKTTDDCSDTPTGTLSRMTKPDAPAVARVNPEADDPFFPLERVVDFKKGSTKIFRHEGEVRLEHEVMQRPSIILVDDGESGPDLGTLFEEDFGPGGDVLRRSSATDGSFFYKPTGERSLGRFKITIERIEDVPE